MVVDVVRLVVLVVEVKRRVVVVEVVVRRVVLLDDRVELLPEARAGVKTRRVRICQYAVL